MSIANWASCGALGDAIWMLGEGWTLTPIRKRLQVDYPQLSADEITAAILFAQQARTAAAILSRRRRDRKPRSSDYPVVPEE